jgi:hypothetical protein
MMREGVMRLTRRRSVPPAFMLVGLLSLEDIPAVGSWGLRTEWLQLLVNGGLFEDYDILLKLKRFGLREGIMVGRN